MFLVRLIDVFVGILEFIFKSEKRAQGSSPAVLGTAGILTLVTLLGLALVVPQLIYLKNTDSYAAELSNASGLTTADPVLVAGVPTGRIEKIELAGDHVRVAFRLDTDQPLGNHTRASVRLRTVLGKRYLEIIPAGTGPVGEHRTIPLSRTTVPYSLDDISASMVNSSTKIDPTTLRTMMSTLGQLVPESKDLSQSLAGAAAATSTITHSGAQLDQLLTVSKKIAHITAQQSDLIADSISSTQAIVQTLVVRRVVLTRLAENLRLALSQMATTFPTIPMAELVANVQKVTSTLATNAGNINEILKKLPPAMRIITDFTGNGNWSDVTSPAAVLPDNLLCTLGIMQGCR